MRQLPWQKILVLVSFRVHIAVVAILLFISIDQAAASAVSPSFTLDGHLLKTGTTESLLDTNVQITVQLLNPTKDCVLLEEVHSANTQISGGHYSLQVGASAATSTIVDGYPHRGTNDLRLPIRQIYQNTAKISPGAGATSTCEYTPVTGESRFLRLIITPSSTGIATTLAPDTEIGSVPQALVAETVQGYSVDQLLILDPTGASDLTQANVQSLFAAGNATKLQNLLNVNINRLVQTGVGGGVQLPTSAPSTPALGQIWYEGGAIKYRDGSTVQTLGTSGSGITSLDIADATLKLNNSASPAGGTISTGGNSIAVNVGTSANQIVQMQDVSGVAKLPAVDGSQLTNVVAGALSATAAISTSGNITTTGDISARDITATQTLTAVTGSIASLSTRALNLTNATNQRLVIQAPTSITGTPVFTWPSGYGADDQFLRTNASGTLSWVSFPTSLAPSGSAGGDLGGTYPGPAVEKIRGNAVATGTLVPGDAGKIYKWSGSAFVAAHIGVNDLYSSAGSQQFATASCSNHQTVTWASVTDSFICQNIEIAADKITSGTIDEARLPASTKYWQPISVGSPDIHYSGGKVGIGLNYPQSILHIKKEAQIGETSIKGIEVETYNYQGGSPVAVTILNLYAESQGSGSTSSITGVNIGVINNNANPTGIATGALIEVKKGSDGSAVVPTNSYGVKIGTIEGSTSRHSIFAGDSNAPSYFAGRIGIGTGKETPGVALDVNGTIRATAFEGPLTSSVSTVGAGSNTAPSLTFTGNTNTGFYSGGAGSNIISITNNGAKTFDITTVGLISPTTGGASVRSLAGNATTPTYSFAGDSDTGWYSPAPDTLAASTAGQERIRIDSSGRIGVGVDTLLVPFEIQAMPGGAGLNIRGHATTASILSLTTKMGAAWADSNHLHWNFAGLSSTHATQANDLLINYFDGAVTRTALKIESETRDVGIGVTTPKAKLHVGGGILSNSKIASNSPDESKHISIEAINDGGGYAGKLRFGGTGTDANTFQIQGVGDVPALTIANTKVGIGIESPSTKMHIADSSANIPLSVDNYGSSGTIASGLQGRVARGTLLVPAPTASGDGVGMVMSTHGGSTWANSAAVYLKASETHSETTRGSRIIFESTEAGKIVREERMRIEHNGNVGIGTTNPVGKLHVSAGGSLVRDLMLVPGSDTKVTNLGAIRTDATTTWNMNFDSLQGFAFNIDTDSNQPNASNFDVNNSAGTPLLRVTQNGNVGIGTGTGTPTQKLTVSGAGSTFLRVDSTSGNGNTVGLNLIGGATNANWTIGTNESAAFGAGDSIGFFKNAGTTGAKLIIQNNGYVGIGTSSPAMTLDVNGNIQSRTGLFYSSLRTNYFLALQNDRNMILYDNGAAVWASGTGVSDIRYKKDITPLENVLPELKNLSTIRFKYLDSVDETGQPQIGLVAQEIVQKFPELTFYDSKSDRHLIYYDKLTTLLIKGLQEIMVWLQGHDNQIEDLKKENQRLAASQNLQSRELSSLKEENRTLLDQHAKKEQKIQTLELKIKLQEQETKARLDKLEKLLNSK